MEHFLRNGTGRGRKAANLPLVLGTAELTASEVATLGEREAGIKPTPLQRVTTRHKKAARLLAKGETVSQVSLATGLTVSRISILKQDPAFQEQVSVYQTEAEERVRAYDDVVVEGLQNLTIDAIEELERRIAEEGEDLSSGELLSIIRQGADRTGHAPKRVEERSLTVNFGDRLQEARKRALAAASSQIIDAEVIEG